MGLNGSHTFRARPAAPLVVVLLLLNVLMLVAGIAAVRARPSQVGPWLVMIAMTSGYPLTYSKRARLTLTPETLTLRGAFTTQDPVPRGEVGEVHESTGAVLIIGASGRVLLKVNAILLPQVSTKELALALGVPLTHRYERRIISPPQPSRASSAVVIIGGVTLLLVGVLTRYLGFPLFLAGGYLALVGVGNVKGRHDDQVPRPGGQDARGPLGGAVRTILGVVTAGAAYVLLVQLRR